MKRTSRLATLAWLAIAGPAFAQGVAFVTDLKGAVQAEGAAPPALLSELAPGTKLKLPPDTALNVMFAATGREYMLKGPGEYEVRPREIAATKGLAPKARDTEWESSERVLAGAAHAAAASVRMRSLGKPAAGAANDAFPAGGNVATLQPVFRWNAATAGAADFEVLTEGRDTPVHQARAIQAGYKLPAKLEADRDYYWRATTHGDELGSGRFHTLPAEALRTVDARRPGPKAGFSDRLMFALLLQDLGATQEARELWTALAKERPGLPELPAK